MLSRTFAKQFVILGILSFFAYNNLCAQVAMTIKSNRKNYHQYERPYLLLTLNNYSGTSLIFGSTKNLSGTVTIRIKKPGTYNDMTEDFIKLELDNFILKPGVPYNLKIDLGKYLSLGKVGSYKLKAILTHGNLASGYESNYIFFTVSKGFYVWETTVGTPTLPGQAVGDKVATISYKLDSMFDGKDKVYYFLVEDAKRVYRVARIGVDYGIAAPQCRVDFLSRAHILIQDSSKIFSYFVYDTSGELIKHHVYKKVSASTPYLGLDESTGSIRVLGGDMARKGIDFDVEN
jgi:hypothetical protein